MNDISTQKEKAIIFRDLHHSPKLLLLPNIWDVLGGALLKDLGFPAIATASASIAYANGYLDGEQIPFKELISIVRKITNGVSLPVSVDFESGYAKTTSQLRTNVAKLIEAGAIGINIEDTDHSTGKLYSVARQAQRIETIREVAEKVNLPLFINARTDVFIPGKFYGENNNMLDETILRGNTYRAAGADGFYPILLNKMDLIKQIVMEIQMPLNILLAPRVTDLKKLEEAGVARVSLGPGFLRASIYAMKAYATELKSLTSDREFDEIQVTSDYLKKLIS